MNITKPLLERRDKSVNLDVAELLKFKKFSSSKHLFGSNLNPARDTDREEVTDRIAPVGSDDTAGSKTGRAIQKSPVSNFQSYDAQTPN